MSNQTTSGTSAVPSPVRNHCAFSFAQVCEAYSMSKAEVFQAMLKEGLCSVLVSGGKSGRQYFLDVQIADWLEKNPHRRSADIYF